MSRFVHAKPKQTGKAASASAGENPVKEYAERIAKYVPAEIVAAYTAIVAVFANSTPETKYWGLLISTCFFWAMTWVYLYWLRKPQDKAAYNTQLVMSLIAFIIWAYATSGDDGVFGTGGLDLYKSEISAALMISFSFVSGFIVPKKEEPPH